MSEFVFLYRGGERPSGTPAEMQQVMQRWMAWMKELDDKGNLKSRGLPLEPEGKIVRSKSVVDGPFAEAKDVIGGFTVVEAKDLAHAVELSKGCPILTIGGEVEVRPALRM